jgi:hypothetical protein
MELAANRPTQTATNAALKTETITPVLPAASTTEGSSLKLESDESMKPQALPEPSLEESKNTLVIKNLPFKFTKPELDQLLITHQAKAKNVRMLRDGSGRFTGIAFIRCPSKEEAGRLILAMNGIDIGGRFIQVEFKKKKKKVPKKPEVAPSASAAVPSMMVPPTTAGIPPGFVPPTMHMPPYGYPVGMTGDARRSFLTASGSTLRTMNQPVGGLRASASGVPLTSSTSSVDDEEYLNHPGYSRRRASTSSVEDEDYLPRSLSSSMDDANAILHHYQQQQQHLHFPNSRLSLSLSSGVANSRYPLPHVRPVRQPIGPDGKSTGFSEEYRRNRTCLASQ